MDYVDLFAGCGGWEVAATQLGLQGVGVEFDKSACLTRRAAGFATVEADVRTLDPLAPEFASEGLIASPPCQTFSLAGNGSGRRALNDVLNGIHRMMVGHALTDFEDDRTALVLEPLRWIIARVRAGNPYKWIALEQVPTVLPVWEEYAEVLRQMGYSVEVGKLSAEEFGVPQTRKRAILVARLGTEVSLPAATHMRYKKGTPQDFVTDGLEPWVSMVDALGATEALRSNYGTGGDPKNRGVRQAEEPAPTVTSKVDRNKWLPNTAVEGDTSWTSVRPSPTIVGSFAPDVVAAPGWRKAGDGPRQSQPGSVRVTVVEAGVLQTFPADFPWQGAKGKRYQQCGNAVPPLLAKAILKEVTG